MSQAEQPADAGPSPREKARRMRKQAAEEKSSEKSSSSTSGQPDDDEEAESLQQELENQLADDTVRLPVANQRFRFTTFNGPLEGCPAHPDEGKIEYGGQLSDLIALMDERLDRMKSDDFEEQYTEEVDWMCDVLEWASYSDALDAGFWKRNFGIKRRRAYLTFIQQERNLKRGDIKKLLQAGRL